MVLNEFNIVVTPESETQVIQYIKDAGGILDFLRDLSPEARLRQAKMALSRQDFIEKTLIHGEQNPSVLPQYTDLKSFQNSVELITTLERIHAQVKPLNEKLQDTILLVRAEAYEVARAFYSAAKEAAKHGVPGMEHVIKDLSYHFRRCAPTKDGENGNTGKSKKKGNTVNTDQQPA